MFPTTPTRYAFWCCWRALLTLLFVNLAVREVLNYWSSTSKSLFSTSVIFILSRVLCGCYLVLILFNSYIVVFSVPCFQVPWIHVQRINNTECFISSISDEKLVEALVFLCQCNLILPPNEVSYVLLFGNVCICI